MHESNMHLDNSTIFNNTIFRTPLGFEKRLGLWVDRIGRGRNRVAVMADGASVFPESQMHGQSTGARLHGPGTDGLRRLGLFGAVLIDEGCGVFRSPRAGLQRMGPGDVVLLFPAEPHNYIPDETWLQRWIVWGGPLASSLLEVDDSIMAKPVIQDCAHPFSACFMVLQRLLGKEDFYGTLGRAAALTELCAAIARLRHGPGLVRDASTAVAEAVEWTRLNCTEPLTGSDLAARAGMPVGNKILQPIIRGYNKMPAACSRCSR
jgi:hypothetical protein